MTAFDGARNDDDPGLVLHDTRPHLRVIRSGGWRQAWYRIGPLLPIAFAFGTLLGSYLAFVARVMGG